MRAVIMKTSRMAKFAKQKPELRRKPKLINWCCGVRYKEGN
jgi:hypothetical protein